VSQIVFGSDYPFGAGEGPHLRGLAKCGFNADELRAIHRENVLRVLPKYKT
jgi:predicted TIM-barrel fold metal-dependent hydrolase